MTEKQKIAFAFPGVGVKSSGYEIDFYLRHRNEINHFFEEASQICGEKLSPENLKSNNSSERMHQIYTYTLSCAFAAVIKQSGYQPFLTAGYSFGVYGALFGSEAINFSDGLKILIEAHEIMKEKSKNLNAGMCVIAGLTEEDILKITEELSPSKIRIVNSNSNICKVLAGEKEKLEALCKKAIETGATSAQILPLSIPYHHPFFLSGVSEKFRKALDSITFKKPVCPIVSSINQSLLTTADEIISFISNNLSTPINWQKVIEKFIREGVSMIIECGPGLTLTRNAKFIDGCPEFVNFKNIEKKLGI